MGLFDTIKGAAKGAKQKYDEYQAKAPEREAAAKVKREKELERLKFETQKAKLTQQKLKVEAQVRETRQARFKNLTMGFGGSSTPMLSRASSRSSAGGIGQPIFSSYSGYKTPATPKAKKHHKKGSKKGKSITITYN